MHIESVRHAYLRHVTAPFLRLLGPRLSLAIASQISRGIFEMNTAGRAVAESRLRDAIGRSELDPHAIQRTIARMYEHLGRFWIETLFSQRLMRSDDWRENIDVEDEKRIQTLGAEKRGCILASGYLGNPAMCAFALGQILGSVHVLIDLDAFPALRGWEGYLRKVPGVELIPRSAASRDIPIILQRGGAVWMIAEHHRPRGAAIETQFLGRTLRAFPTMERLAQWFKVPIGVVTAIRSDSDRFRFVLHCHDIVEPSLAAPDGALTRSVLSTLEAAILTHPQQYLWNIPTTPPAESRIRRITRPTMESIAPIAVM
jgi:lauroyl/myristoyl acyltransferase